MKKNIFIAFFLFLLASPSVAEDDLQYWSLFSLKLVDTEKVDFVQYTELQFNEDISKNKLWLNSSRLQYKPFENLGLNLHYTYLETKTTSVVSRQKEYQYHHRLELEVNPSYKWDNGIKLSTRNRFEFRWIEDKGSDNARYRHRDRITFPIKKVDWIKNFSISNEIFWDFNQQEFNQDRFVPFSLTFPLRDKVSLNVFYQMQWLKSSTSWNSNHALATHFLISF